MGISTTRPHQPYPPAQHPQALLDRDLISPQRAVISLTNSAEIASALDKLFIRVQNDPSKNTVLHSLHAIRVLTLLLIDPPQIISNKPECEKRDPLVDRALEYIWSRSQHVLCVEDVVAEIGVGRRTLERKMLAALGHGVLNEIIECRFHRAERLLRETDLPTTTVVRLAGFGSNENMRSIFLSRTKLAPIHYRNRFRRPRVLLESDRTTW